jgi:hypothetical protein
MESNLERANSRRREGAKPTGLLAGLVSRNMRHSPADQVAGLPKGRSLMMSTTISKGSSCGACGSRRRVWLRTRPREWRSTGPARSGDATCAEDELTHEIAEAFPRSSTPPSTQRMGASPSPALHAYRRVGLGSRGRPASRYRAPHENSDARRSVMQPSAARPSLTRVVVFMHCIPMLHTKPRAPIPR